MWWNSFWIDIRLKEKGMITVQAMDRLRHELFRK